ncbi:MAG: hypothetical protein QMD09_13560 [Desulfatibacillaceae bacterium]|nr:hypothetical protein [Desulfatibacillaceae bacterium]
MASMSMQEFKNQREYYNLNLSPQDIVALLENRDWYQLLIPDEEMDLRSFGQVRQWQEIAVSLLKKYCDRYYRHHKSQWENQHLEYRVLDESDPNFFDEYICSIKRSQDDIVTKLEELRDMIKSGAFNDFEYQGFLSVMFGQHLYRPLLFVKNGSIEVRPTPLNEGERDFVLGLKKFYEANELKFKGKELYLLRNRSRGSGIGFFEAGNFYPDFILWIVKNNDQQINFVDPKGLRNVDGLKDPKIRFFQTIKEIEKRLGDASVVLESFIISNTPYNQIAWWGEGLTLEDFEKRHILFQYDQKDDYIHKLLTMAGL